MCHVFGGVQMPAPDDADDARDRARRLLGEVPNVPSIAFPGDGSLDALASEVSGMLDGVRPDPEDVERALETVDIAGVGSLDVEASALPSGVGVDAAQADAVVDAGGQAVEFAVEESGEAATVVVDAGDEALEVAVEEGGDVAAEAVVEALAAALEAA